MVWNFILTTLKTEEKQKKRKAINKKWSNIKPMAMHNVIKTIGVGAGIFLRVRRIFPRIFPNLPEKFFCDFACIFSATRRPFWYDLQKRAFMCFSANVGRHFLKSSNLGRHLSRDFPRIFDKSRLLGMCLQPRFLHHWLKRSMTNESST